MSKKPTIVTKIKVGEPKRRVSKSQAKRNFEALIEAYKIQNPAKYEIKKAVLEAQLKSL